MNIKENIDKQIEELNERRFLFIIKSKRLKDYSKLEERLVMAKRGYSWFIILSVVAGGFLFFAVFAQLFLHNLIDWAQSGLLITFTITTFGKAWDYKIDCERFRMMKYLIELKEKIE